MMLEVAYLKTEESTIREVINVAQSGETIEMYTTELEELHLNWNSISNNSITILWLHFNTDILILIILILVVTLELVVLFCYYYSSSGHVIHELLCYNY